MAEQNHEHTGAPTLSDTPDANEPVEAEEPMTTEADSKTSDSEQLRLLVGQISLLNERASHRESVIDRLHADNDRLREGLDRKLIEPIVASLIRLLGHMEAEQSRCVDAEETGIPLNMAQGFLWEVEDILDSCGVRRFTPLEGDAVEPDRHRVQERRSTQDPDQHNTVVTILTDGFAEQAGDRIYQPAAVAVARYEVPMNDQHQPGQDDQAESQSIDAEAAVNAPAREETTEQS